MGQVANPRFNPKFEVANASVVLHPLEIVSVSLTKLGRPVASLEIASSAPWMICWRGLGLRHGRCRLQLIGAPPRACLTFPFNHATFVTCAPLPATPKLELSPSRSAFR